MLSQGYWGSGRRVTDGWYCSTVFACRAAEHVLVNGRHWRRIRVWGEVSNGNGVERPKYTVDAASSMYLGSVEDHVGYSRVRPDP